MDYEQYKIKEYPHWSVFLHTNQYFLGRTYLYAKREDAIDFISMTPDEQKEFFDVGKTVTAAVQELFRPDLMNYAALGNIHGHLHVHFIPRYKDSREFEGQKFLDERWGKNYAPYNYDFTIPEPTLFKIRDALKQKLS